MGLRSQKALFEVGPDASLWDQAAEEDRLAAQVVFNRPLETVYSYLVPDSLRDKLEPGQRVRAPFGKGNRPTLGYCVGLTHEIPQQRRLKELSEICDRKPLIDAAMLELSRWISERYLCGWGQVLEGIIPAGVKRQAGTREILYFELSRELDPAARFPAKQLAVINALRDSDRALTAAELTEFAGCGLSPIETLRRKGVLIPIRRRSLVADASLNQVSRQSDLTLNSEQQVCLDRIVELLRSQRHETLLMRGVTGSGKTEVYIQAIREVVSYGRQAIVLVPEISLTPQTIRRFQARFESVAVLHSHLSDADRHWHWQQIAEGQVQVVVGARSAVFAPCPQLGLIVIDEEHETTFKQQSTPRYHAREVARARARRLGIPLVLGSATPMLESLLRTQQGKDQLLTLQQRVAGRPLPHVSIVDTRNDPLVGKRHALGRAMEHGIRRALQERGQVILFLNLRGYSPLLWCLKCGGMRCPDCDITLTWHKDKDRLLCHSCEYTMPPPERCMQCGQPGLRFLGTGTQRLESEVRTRFPGAKILRMDSDSMQSPGSHDAALEAFRKREIDILLGTQMIAKGLDFPDVTLVGVVDADTLLFQPDLRAAERTFQLIAQVAGRTGRGEREGRVLVQTMSPEEPVIRFAARHDYEAFSQWELENRAAALAPPYVSMARVILRSPVERLAQDESRRLAEMLRSAAGESGGLRILGPAPAPVTRLRKHFRYHLQITADTFDAIRKLWQTVGRGFAIHPEVELIIDVDPVDLR